MLSKRYSSLSTHTRVDLYSYCRFLKKDVPGRGCLGYLCCCCFHAPQATVTVHLDTAQDLAKQDIVGAGELITHSLRLYYLIVDRGEQGSSITAVCDTENDIYSTNLARSHRLSPLKGSGYMKCHFSHLVCYT